MSSQFNIESNSNKKNKPVKSIILLFIDGIGFGSKDRGKNPFSRYESEFFGPLGGRLSLPVSGSLLETDATLGVEGIPQSGTGQTAIFTGYNASEIMGRHAAGFPPFTLRPYLRNESILKKFVDNGFLATLANAYTHHYYDRIKGPRGERFMSASTMIQLGAGLELLNLDDLKAGRAIFMDLTHWFLRTLVPELKLIPAKECGRNLVQIARNYDLIVYEYFFPDRCGHEGDMLDARKTLRQMDEFLSGIWEELDPEKESIVICSDHGNFEDLSHGTHTMNKIPTFLYGELEDYLKTRINTLYDIPRAIMDYMGIEYSIP